MINGDVTKRTVKLSEIDTIGERENRLFQVSCREDFFRVEKFFQKRKNLKSYLKRKDVTDVTISIIDIHKEV